MRGKSAKPPVMKRAVAALQQGVGAAGRGEAHGDRRELGVERRAGHQPGREHRRLLRRAQLAGGAGKIARR